MINVTLCRKFVQDGAEGTSTLGTRWRRLRLPALPSVGTTTGTFETAFSLGVSADVQGEVRSVELYGGRPEVIVVLDDHLVEDKEAWQDIQRRWGRFCFHKPGRFPPKRTHKRRPAP